MLNNSSYPRAIPSPVSLRSKLNAKDPREDNWQTIPRLRKTSVPTSTKLSRSKASDKRRIRIWSAITLVVRRMRSTTTYYRTRSINSKKKSNSHASRHMLRENQLWIQTINFLKDRNRGNCYKKSRKDWSSCNTSRRSMSSLILNSPTALRSAYSMMKLLHELWNRQKRPCHTNQISCLRDSMTSFPRWEIRTSVVPRGLSSLSRSWALEYDWPTILFLSKTAGMAYLTRGHCLWSRISVITKQQEAKIAS